MKQNRDLQINTQSFPFYLRRSFYVHIALVVVFALGGKAILFQQERIRNANIELVTASVRVDMVAMPTHTLNELKNLSSGVEDAKKEEISAIEEKKAEEKAPAEPEKVENAKIEAKDEGAVFEKANEKKRQNFLEKLKQLGNKKIKSEGQVKAEKGVYGEKSTDLKQLILAGNKLSKGTAMYGDSNGAEMTAFQAYAARLPDLVRPHWRLPSFLLDKKLKARVRVWISPNGEVVRAEVYQSSGESEYDQRAVEAVKASSPFPGLSQEFSKRGLNGDILLGFPL